VSIIDTPSDGGGMARMGFNALAAPDAARHLEEDEKDTLDSIEGAKINDL
jgi:hypothetical protein